jgi:hypothetical protein
MLYTDNTFNSLHSDLLHTLWQQDFDVEYDVYMWMDFMSMSDFFTGIVQDLSEKVNQ